MTDTDCVTVKGPLPAVESTTTSPPLLVLEIATSKVRHGSGTVQLAISLPVSDTALRLFSPNTADTEKTNTATICKNRRRMIPPPCCEATHYVTVEGETD